MGWADYNTGTNTEGLSLKKFTAVGLFSAHSEGFARRCVVVVSGSGAMSNEFCIIWDG